MSLNFGAVLRGLDQICCGGSRLASRWDWRGSSAGSLIGIVAALCRRSSAAGPARIVVRLYVGLIRNVPILVLALFAFFALPQYGIRFGNTTTFAAVLAIYAGAYLAESFRAAMIMVPSGVLEAARSIGLTGTGIALWVVLPIAAPQRLAERRQQLHLAVQGHFDRRRHRGARAHLPGAQDQQ